MRILAIDKDAERMEWAMKMWEKRGIILEHIDSISEAIVRLKSQPYFLVGINADNTEYDPQFNVVRDLAQCPIILFTSDLSVQRLTLAYEVGIDMVLPHTNEDCTLSILVFVQRYHERRQANGKSLKVLATHDITIIPLYHRVFHTDTELVFTKIEFDILYYLTLNRGRVLSYQQIYHYVWHDEYDEASHDVLWSSIKRIRKKLRSVSPEYEYIETVRGVGYRVPLERDRNM